VEPKEKNIKKARWLDSAHIIKKLNEKSRELNLEVLECSE
jgi:hypothetical protein